MSGDNNGSSINIDITSRPWYFDIQDAFRCGPSYKNNGNRTDNTTFQQVFFGAVLSCAAYAECMQTIHSSVLPSDEEDKFYEALENGIENVSIETETQNNVLNFIKERLDRIISGIFGKVFDLYEYTDYDKMSVKYKISRNTAGTYRYRDIENTYTYKKNASQILIYDQYESHKGFFLSFLCHILRLMTGSGQEKIDNIRSIVRDKLKGKLSYIPGTEGMNDTLHITAHYLYFLILASINREDFIRLNSKSGHLAGITDNGDIYIRQQRDDYIAVTEYYPVNTVERLGALENLAENDNIYAMQELYFLYQNNTVLYNVKGQKRALLLSDLNKTEKFYKKLKEKGDSLYLPVLRTALSHADNVKCDIPNNFAVKRLIDEQKKYESGGYKPAKDKNGGSDYSDIRNMVIDLYENILNNKAVPFNVEMVWFLDGVLKDHGVDKLHGKEIDKIRLYINNVMTNYPWISSLMKQYDKNNVDLLSLLFELYDYGIGEEALISLCRSYNKEELSDQYQTAYTRSAEYEGKYNLFKHEPYKEQADTWKSVAEIIRQAYMSLNSSD